MCVSRRHTRASTRTLQVFPSAETDELFAVTQFAPSTEKSDALKKR